MKSIFLKIFFIAALFSISNLSAQVAKNTKIIQDPSELESKQISLDCKWDYFDNQFFDPGHFYPIDDWNESFVTEHGGKSVSLPYAIEGGQGYATYHCRVENLIPNQYYALFLYKSIYGAADVFANGKSVFLSNATTGKKDSGIKATRHIRPVVFSADKFGVADLVIHVSSYELAKGGILLVPKITTARNADHIVFKNIALESLLAGVLIILALYNLVIYLLNKKQRMYLYLSLLSFTLVFVSITLEFSLISYMSADIGVGLHFRMVLLSLSLIIPLYNLYATNLYEIKYKWNWIVLLLDFAVPVFYIFAPIGFATRFSVVIASVILLYVNSIYLCWLIKKNSKSPKMFYFFNIVIIVAMLITALYGLMIGQYESSDNSGIFFFKIAIMCFAICQSSLAGIKRDLLSTENKALLDKYEKLNQSYKKFVSTEVTDFFQKDIIDEVEPGDNSLCDGMIVYGKIFSDWKENVFSDAELFVMLDDFYNGLITITKAYKGFFSKIADNTFTVIFTEKTDKPVRCAVALQKYLVSVNKKYEKKFTVNLEIAIHSSKLAIGLVGNEKHLASYNCSAGIDDVRKVCAMNKRLGSNIVITEQALDYCRTYIDALYEGIIVMIDDMKTLVYKVVPFENNVSSVEFLHGDGE